MEKIWNFLEKRRGISIDSRLQILISFKQLIDKIASRCQVEKQPLKNSYQQNNNEPKRSNICHLQLSALNQNK